MALIIWPMGSRTDYRLTLFLRQNTSLDPVTVAARGCGAKNPSAPLFHLGRVTGPVARPTVGGAIGDATRRLVSRADANAMVRKG